jgi:predicted regulator of amino acid metabolism with ACT domain
MVQCGLRVRDGKVWCGEIELADTAVARASGVDRRVVTATVGTIGDNEELRAFFACLYPVGSLREAAPLMGWGAIEILPTDAGKPGILAGVASLIAEAGISIRQVVSDDPDIAENPKAFIITEQPVPERLLPRIRQVNGVRGVVLH